MVQPVSATLIVAACSARPPGNSAIAVTWRGLPGVAGAAMSTPTSATCPAPGWARSSRTGTGVLTPGPSTRTVTGVLAGARSGGRPSSHRDPDDLQRVRRVPPNRSVPATLVIRMALS